MLPYLHLFGLSVPMYGVLILLGLVLGVLFAVFRAKLLELKREDVFFSCLFAVIGLVVGGKLLYVATMVPWLMQHAELLASSELWMALLQGGFVFYGGLIGALLMVFWYTKMYRIPFLDMADTLMPSVPLVHALGRVGCFCAGCCYGVPSELFGVVFSPESVAPQGVRLFPVQLVEAGCNLALFALLAVLGRKPRRRGLLTGIYLLCYALLRFILEFFRYDAERGGFLGVSTSQWISLLLIPVAVLLLAGKQPGRRSDTARGEK